MPTRERKTGNRVKDKTRKRRKENLPRKKYTKRGESFTAKYRSRPSLRFDRGRWQTAWRQNATGHNGAVSLTHAGCLPCPSCADGHHHNATHCCNPPPPTVIMVAKHPSSSGAVSTIYNTTLRQPLSSAWQLVSRTDVVHQPPSPHVMMPHTR